MAKPVKRAAKRSKPSGITTNPVPHVAPDATPDFDAVMTLARRWHYSKIQDLASEAIRECLAEHPKDSDRERREFLTRWIDETTDGHSHVIYTDRAWMVLAASDECDAWEEYGSEMDVSAKACVAMRADVWSCVDGRSDEWNVCADESDDE